MEKEITEQFQMILGAIEASEKRLRAEILTKDDVEPLTDRAANKAAALIEEKLGKRIDTLFDGYKLTHEKQYELERRVERLERIILEL